MPATFPFTRRESRVEGLEKPGAQAGGDPEDSNAPQFLLLDTSGPHPGALVLSFGSLSALLVFTVVVSHSLSATRSPRTEFFSEIVAPPEPLWLPPNPPAVNPHEKSTPLSEPGEQVKEASPPPAAPDQPAEPAKADLLPQPQLAVLPLPSSDVVSPALKLAPFRTPVSHAAPSVPRSSAPETLGTLPLPRLLDRETALAAGFAVLNPEQRLALPRVSIRVNAEWLDALP